MGFEHYKYLTERREEAGKLLESIVAESRSREAAEEAERQRASHFRHKACMEQFRAKIRGQDCYTEEEKAEIIAASFEW